MSDRSDIVYVYDGSFDGLLCCIFEGYTKREKPVDIVTDDKSQCFLYPQKIIYTVEKNAQRVYKSLEIKMSKDCKRLVERAFLHGSEDKAIWIYRFICMGYDMGKKIFDMHADEVVNQVHKMAQTVGREEHMMLEFLRFSEYEGRLIGVIEPKHYVLPLMIPHFSDRFPNEEFMIFDKAHKMAAIYSNHRSQIIEMENVELPPPDRLEMLQRNLWKKYYDTIAIKERENPRCRMTHMPKRFWKHMTEMNDELRKDSPPQIEKRHDKFTLNE